MTDSAQSPGQILRQARLARGWDERRLCEAPGITERTLKALEHDDYDHLPAQLFVRGYIRNYSRLLNLRVGAILARFEEHYQAHCDAGQPVIQPVHRSPQSVVMGSVAAFLLVSTLVTWTLYSQGEDLSITRTPDTLPIRPMSSAVSADGLVLSLHSDSWIQVIDANDHILAVDLYRAGAELVLEGQPPFEINLGHGPGVKVSYNGRPVDVYYDPETLSAEMTVGQ